MDRLFQKLESLLFSLLIFLIPTNLFLTFLKDQAYVGGIFIDYLTPKLYLSDLVIFSIFLLWMLRNSKKVNILKSKLTKHHKSITLPFLLLSLVLAASATNSHLPISAFWFLAKLIQITLLIIYIKQYIKLKNVIKPLQFTFFFQAIIAILQWVQKKSLLGYLFLGESSLTTSHIARAAIQGEIRPLAYGTTAHPNILAGFAVISFLIILVAKNLLTKPPSPHTKTTPSLLIKLKTTYQYAQTAFTLTILSTVLILTQSITATFALGVGLIAYKFPDKTKKFYLPLAGLIIGLALFTTNFVDTQSIDRRLQLAAIATKMTANNIFLGVGPNNFTAHITAYGEIPGTTRFLQPVHNIYLLWFSETGLLGTAALAYAAWTFRHKLRKIFSNRFLLTIPLIAILTIGMADHYPLTLQTGQLLFALTLGLTLTKTPLTQ